MSVWETLSIGSDESGKGDFFGAPSVVAVKLDENTLSKLKKQSYYYKIQDSKSCNDVLIKDLAPKIMQVCKYSDVSINPKQYNILYRKLKNVNIILATMHNKAHMGLEGEGPRIMDAFANERIYYKYLSDQNIEPVKIDNFCTKAESQYLSVALASIIARYKFIMQIEEMSSKSGVRIPYGNSYNPPNSVITAYKELALKYREEEIDSEFVKSHFSTLEKIKKLR